MNRRQILVGALAGAGLLTLAPLPLLAEAEPPKADPATGLFPNDRMLGDRATAKAILIEYASLSCPHCRDFHKNILPPLKADWVDQGKLLYVYRDFPLNAPALWAAMVANCLTSNDLYFAYIKLLYENQDSWLTAQDIPGALKPYAQAVGMDEATFDRCINDEAEIDRIVAQVEYAQATYGVDSTPAVILNGSRVKPRSYEELSQLIADSLE